MGALEFGLHLDGHVVVRDRFGEPAEAVEQVRARPSVVRIAWLELERYRVIAERFLGSVERLEKIFDIIDKPARGKKCEAIEGLIDEGKEIMEDFKGAPALDAGLLAAAQAVEHYEISRYGTLRTWAEALGHSQAVKLLDQTLMEEKNTDATLTEIALAVANPEAQQAAE